jgi:hypothetical protein
MDGERFDAFTRAWATASRRRLLRGFVGGGIGALGTALGREPASAQVCTTLPCANDPSRCGAMASNCVCCRYVGGTQCLNRTQCRGYRGTVVEPCGEASAPCTEHTHCCSGRCFSDGPEGCCPTCPEGCTCNAIPRSAPSGASQVVCIREGVFGPSCNPREPDCPVGQVCIGANCLTTCEPVA